MGGDQEHEVAIEKIGPGLMHHGQVSEGSGIVARPALVVVRSVVRAEGLVVPWEASTMRQGVFNG